MRLSALSILSFFFLYFSLPVMAQHRCQTQGDRRVCTNSKKQIVRVDELQGDGRVEKRMLFDPETKKLRQTIFPRYAQNSPYSPEWVEAFRIENSRGHTIRSFDNLDFQNCRGQLPKRHKVMIAENYGIDLTHPALDQKVIKASELDRVQTGTCGGFYVNSEDEVLPHAVGRPFHEGNFLDMDHGTMVSTVALEGVENAGLYPVSGELKSDMFYEQMSEAIQNHQIGLVNMSLSFAQKRSPHLSWRDSFGAAKNAITQTIQDNPETLFIAASGNGRFGGFTYDAVNLNSSAHYPASIRLQNLFSVGAINSSEIKVEKLPEYRMTYFSNYSIRNVDILAPGVGVKSGRVGGGYGPASGTSFSSPYIMNQVMKLSNIAPHLSYIQIKELMMKTVYIPSVEKAAQYGMHWRGEYTKEDREKGEWFPVRSGGIYHPERAAVAARELAKYPDMSIDQAVEKQFTPGEFQLRSRMWQRRDM